jgi:SecD/SecF fusion protein
MGYSLNDTIVIFDRMRENLGNIKGSFKEVLDISINQTLDRTILTALTVFVTVVVLLGFNFGQRSGIEGMAFTLLVGVIVGTYSTVYIATPILLWLHGREEAKKGGPPGTLVSKRAVPA